VVLILQINEKRHVDFAVLVMGSGGMDFDPLFISKRKRGSGILEGK
jgi:hypothetical protein